MKKISLLLSAAVLFFLTSCDTTREISIKENGSGEMVTTLDMGALVGMMKMSGQGKDMPDEKLDSTISLAALVDSIPDLTAADKELMKKGTMNMIVNMEDEQMMFKINFPFNSLSDVAQINTLSGKMMKEVMSKEMDEKGAAAAMGGDDVPQSTFEQYFATTYSPGLIEMKLNKEKYASVASDQRAQAMKQAVDQGMPMKEKLIIHLPKPAKKVTGANAKLSEDKKTVTVENDLAAFFDDATKQEFRIEY